MNSNPVISFDLDGTLLNHAERIHPRDLALLKNPPAGCLMLPTTGRPLFSVKEIFNRNGLFAGQALPWPLVMQNGAAIYQCGEQLVEYVPFSAEVRKELIAFARQHPKITFFFMDLAASYTLGVSDYSAQVADRHGLNSRVFEDGAEQCQFSKVLVISDHEDEFNNFAEVVNPLAVKVETSLPGFYEISPLGVSKGKGLMRLLDYIGLTGAKVFAAGDGQNDLSTFEIADFKLAPATAQQKVRARADRVIEWESEGILGPLLRQAGVLAS